MTDVIFLLLTAYILLFIISVMFHDNSYTDVFWGVGFMLVAWYTFFSRESYFFYQIVITALVTLWGIRIALYIGTKKLKTQGEDFRYKEWREQWKYFYTRSFFQIYILQGLLLLVIALPIIYANTENINPGNAVFTIVGGCIALFGLAFETIADLQLSNFMKSKKPGQIFMEGLYSVSRHPNYFGESVFWLGISIIAFPINELSLVSFAMITYLLLYVSGVPMLEKKYEGNKTYQEYKKRVSCFIPWVKGE